MRGWAVTGLAVAALGIVVVSPAVVFIGAAIVFVRALGEIWPERVLAALDYQRSVTPAKTVAGDEVELTLSLWNRTRFPVPFASSEDAISERLHIRVTRSRSKYAPPGPGKLTEDLPDAATALRISGTLRPFERLTRRLRIAPVQRGVHEIGPARLSVAELFGSHTPSRDADTPVTAVVARPLTVPVVGPSEASAPMAQTRVRRSLFADPTLLAGVRPFQPSDPMRSIHWRASAREGTLQTKRFEPALSRQQILVLDVQTVEGPYWLLEYDEDAFERLCIMAVSLARDLVTRETSCGFAAAGFSGTPQRYVFLPPRADRSQLERIGDVLARLTTESSAPLANLLAWLPRRVPAGTTLGVLTARDPLRYAAIARRLGRSGYPVDFTVLGDAERASAARGAGMSVRAARVDGTFRAPEMVVVGG